MSGHSEGPWELGRVTADHGAEVTAGRYCVADVFGIDNARLIAAAPNLLEACKSVVRASLNDRKLTLPEFDAMLAAIAKAEGAP